MHGVWGWSLWRRCNHPRFAAGRGACGGGRVDAVAAVSAIHDLLPGACQIASTIEDTAPMSPSIVGPPAQFADDRSVVGGVDAVDASTSQAGGLDRNPLRPLTGPVEDVVDPLVDQLFGFDRR
jgi:hypothetical protein